MATKSSVISGMGVALSLVQSLVASVRKTAAEAGLSEEEADKQLHRLTTEEGNGVWDKIANLVIEVPKKFGEVFTFIVDYSRSLKDSITAGSYNWVNDDITEEHFPAKPEEQGTKEQSFTLYHFGKDTESDWVIAQMDKDGKRPATIRELLAFGEKNPELQRQFPIIALKSLWVNRNRHRRYSCLFGRSGRRSVLLHWYGYRWRGHCRFLAVSNSLCSPLF